MTIGESALAAVRQTHSAVCLGTLRDAAVPLTVTELATRTGLSRPTVEAVLADLERARVIRVDEATPGQGAGRPARRMIFDSAAGYVAGVDAGPHSIRLVLTDLGGTVVTRSTTALPKHLGRQTRLTALEGCLTAALAQVGADLGSLRAVGIGVAGILGHDHRIASSLAVPEWVAFDLVGQLGRRLGCPVVIENDIKLAALAENRIGAGRDLSTMAFFQLGHRVSLALIMNGAILQGSHRVAGELGSLRGMTWTSSSSRGSLRWRTASTAKAVFTRAAAGDDAAQAEIDAFCKEIAPKIATLALTIDPEAIVIGGGLSRAGAQLLSPLTAAVHHLLMTPEKPAIVTSSLTDDGPVCGALGLAFACWSAEVLGIAELTPPWSAWRVRPTSTSTRPTTSTEKPTETANADNRKKKVS